MTLVLTDRTVRLFADRQRELGRGAGRYRLGAVPPARPGLRRRFTLGVAGWAGVQP